MSERLSRFAITLAVLAIGVAAGCRARGNLRMDGLYRVDSGDSISGYLRFYSDGTVLRVSSRGPMADVARLLKKGFAGAGAGTYKLSGSHISFSTTSKNGTNDFDGTFDGDTLKLDWVSHINGRSGNETYRFVPIELQ